MKVSRYRLTTIGKLGALLFVAPTPIAAYYAIPPQLTDGQRLLAERLQEMGQAPEIFVPSPTILIMLATASLIGMVLLFVGREIVTTEA